MTDHNQYQYITTPSADSISCLPLSQSTTSNTTTECSDARATSPIVSSSHCDEMHKIRSNSYSNSYSNSTDNFFYMLTKLGAINDQITFENHGYHQLYEICPTLQGQLYKASLIHNPNKYVAIKKTSKFSFTEKIATEDGFSFVVSENILKETLIMQLISVDNQCIGDYICKYIDFFETEFDYYLVMEYVPNEMNLKQFIAQSRQYIQAGQLSMKEYKKMIKYLMWQLFVTVQWMHLSMKCCHLDLVSENVMIKNGTFIQNQADGQYSINPKIQIKLTDFGVSEVFHHGFKCEKHHLSIINEGYFAPNVFNGEMFDAQSADNWNLGIILFAGITLGKQLYVPQNMYDCESAYFALHQHRLKEYLTNNDLLKHFDTQLFDLLNGLLNVNEQRRLRGFSILKHPWFFMYYRRYKKQIFKKFAQKQAEISAEFPVYH